MNKICTTIEQAKKLVELGIDTNTADMCLSLFTLIINGNENINQILLPISYKRVTEQQAPSFIKRFPAWSLTALLELMPLINEYNIEYRPIIERHADNGWACKYYNEETRSTNDVYIRRYGKTPLDAAFEMICWLLEDKQS